MIKKNEVATTCLSFLARNRKYLLLGLSFIFLSGVIIFNVFPGKAKVQKSRLWIEYTMSIVKEKKPSPPASARFYAYVSSVYFDVLNLTDDSEQAGFATYQIINHLYPDKAASSTEFFFTTYEKDPSVFIATDVSKKTLNEYYLRIKKDTGYTPPLRSFSPSDWVGEKPIEPTAGKWKRWNIESYTFNVPKPPVFMSKEHLSALKEVKLAASVRSSEQGAAVNFWGGIPGTEAPAGIWQNRLYSVTKKDTLTDFEYAYIQKVLAQTVADAFLECWKVKYTYWTKRPSMVDGTIDLAMDDPRFPSYVSGHSTISRSAAGVLSVLLPEHKTIWMNDAEEAKNSRLWAGIHYPYDNEVGADLGRQVADAVIKHLHLTRID